MGVEGNGPIRRAWVMTVHPGCEGEYERRHSPIWPELESTLKQHGVLKYSIFLVPETHQLFAYVEFESEDQWEAVARTEICRRWWRHMSEIMPCNPDDSPIEKQTIEVFHIEQESHLEGTAFGASAPEGTTAP